MSDRKSLLTLYKQILRSAKSFPSIKQPQMYQAIREEWRENKSLVDKETLQKEWSRAYKGLEQLRQYELSTMTKGNVHSNNWEVTLEQNPMPKPADYEERQAAQKRSSRGQRVSRPPRG